MHEPRPEGNERVQVESGVVGHACSPRTWVAEAEGYHKVKASLF